ncbi:MAG: type IV pilin protein [Aquabacterium sp.]
MSPRPLVQNGRRRAGFTLVEMAIVLVAVALLASLAWPAWTAQQARSTRLDGAAALHRLHAAQEVYHAQQGSYAARLSLLRGAGQADSDGGHYRIALQETAPGRFVATATAQGAQARDRECPVLTLRVEGALVHHQPSRACWLM